MSRAQQLRVISFSGDTCPHPSLITCFWRPKCLVALPRSLYLKRKHVWRRAYACVVWNRLLMPWLGLSELNTLNGPQLVLSLRRSPITSVPGWTYIGPGFSECLGYRILPEKPHGQWSGDPLYYSSTICRTIPGLQQASASAQRWADCVL